MSLIFPATTWHQKEHTQTHKMTTTCISLHQFPSTEPAYIRRLSDSNNSWRKRKSAALMCCTEKPDGRKLDRSGNYYKLLGVSLDSTSQEIKNAYRKLQKMYHPDIAGEKGHENTLLLNKAYGVLIRDDLRREYDASIGRTRVRADGGGGAFDVHRSSWRGPLRPHALFIDENACIGCGECVHHSRNTFIMDEALGSARVKVQYGDDDTKIEVSVNSCPVNCIYWVDTKELGVLEYLMQPQQKEGYGIFGQGWERPANIFMAAEVLNKKFEKQPEQGKNNAWNMNEEETPAQAHARETAGMNLKSGSFSRIWSWLTNSMGQ